jgi:hypothetical protein
MPMVAPVAGRLAGGDPEEDTVRCCQTTCQEITLQSGLALLRCGTCGSQTWTRHGRTVARAEAFAVLAQTYQDAPARNRAAHQAAVAAGAARRAQREAISSRSGAAEAVDLLAGWQVLGVTA